MKTTTTITLANADEVLFNEVLDTFSALGMEMDSWTMEKFRGLSEALQRNGKLTESQRNLLTSLPAKAKQYAANAPANKSRGAKQSYQTEERIPSSKLMTPQERFGEHYPSEMAKWVLSFEAHMMTDWVPSKDEIFLYGRLNRLMGKPYSAPLKWRAEFENFMTT